MGEQEQHYIEMYAIQNALYKKIENDILNNKGKNIVKVGKGTNMFVNQTFGSIEFKNDLDYVYIKYPLYSSKFKEEIKEELGLLYQDYYGVAIREESVRDTAITTLRKACNLFVCIPCDLNKIHYQKLGIDEKVKLREIAVDKVSKGLVIFSEEEQNKKL